MAGVHGIHHVTCIAADAQENLDFYTGLLGMRLVKRSVNQDEPGTYHLFYADAAGTPGADLTFFPWPRLPKSRPGAGLAVEVGLAIGPDSLAWWTQRLIDAGLTPRAAEMRFGETALPFTDPNGLELALIEAGDRAFTPWASGPVPPERQIRGIHSVRLWERELHPTSAFLREVLGLATGGLDSGWHRYLAESGASGTIVDVREVPDAARGAWGTGGVHHVAWRVADADEQLEVRERVEAAGRRPTPVIDRFWFRSVYFLEPGGVLFELATDGPGFAIDESEEQLGEHLILPPWLEPGRDSIEAALPPLRAGGVWHGSERAV